MYHHRSQSAIPSNFQHKIKTYHQRSISEVPLNSSNVTKSSTPKTSTLMDGRIDFIFEIHLPFMINLLNRIIQERDSLYEKTDFDKEPVGLNYWVYSKGIQSLKREGRFICCEIPIELKVVKLIILNEDWTIIIETEKLTIKWQPFASVFSFMQIDISNFVEPIAIETLNRNLPPICDRLSQEIKNAFITVTKILGTPRQVNGKFVSIELKKIHLESHLFSTREHDEFRIFGSLGIGFKVENKNNEQFSGRLPQLVISNLCNFCSGEIGEFPFVSLGENQLDAPCTLDIAIDIPTSGLIETLFTEGTVISETSEEFSKVRVVLGGNAKCVRDRTVDHNVIGLIVQLPLKLFAEKYSTGTWFKRDCEVLIEFKLSVQISEDGLKLDTVGGVYKWVKKPIDVTLYGISIVDVPKMFADELTKQLSNLSESAKKALTRYINSFDKNKLSSLLFPKFLKNSAPFVLFQYKTARLVIKPESKRFLEVQSVQHDTLMRLKARYQIPMEIEPKVNSHKTVTVVKLVEESIQTTVVTTSILSGNK